LTLDHGNLISLVDDLQIVDRQTETEQQSATVWPLRWNDYGETRQVRVAIVLTDGMNNAGAVEPSQAAELAASQNVKVYCVGAGTEGIAPVPGTDPFTGQRILIPARVEIDEETLRSIADKTGGRYYRATDEETLAKIYSEIGSPGTNESQ